MFIDIDKNKIPTGSYEYEGFSYSPNIFTLWSDKDLSDIGIYRVVYPEIPEGKVVTEWDYRINKVTATAIPTLEDAPREVPLSVTKAQGKAALVQKGYYESVLNFLEGMEEPEKTLASIAFNDTNEWSRSSPFLAMASDALGLDEEDLDDLFILAETIKL